MSEHTHSGVVVVGSANMDIVFAVDRVPSAGETLLAESASLYPGGKGLNQAVAAARSGAAVAFVGALGGDDHGAALAEVMRAAAIDTARVRRVEQPTGQAFIVVDPRGENTIVVASGANATVESLDEADAAAVAAASVLLMQLELPLDVVRQAARLARSAGTLVALNAAPAQPLDRELLALTDLLIVNEHEARLISGEQSLESAAAALAALVPSVIVTLGAAGSILYRDGAEPARVAALEVDAVDTTGAGDTFCGALAALLAEGSDLAEAAGFATAAAALSVQAAGAVPSIPTRGRVEQLLDSIPAPRRA